MQTCAIVLKLTAKVEEVKQDAEWNSGDYRLFPHTQPHAVH